MTKKELMYNISVETGLSTADTAKAMNAFIKIVEKTLCKGEEVSIMGLGTFFVSDATTMRKKTAEQPGASPKKEQVPRFRAAPRLKDAVKNKSKKRR